MSPISREPTGLDLLRRLGSGVRPGATQSQQGPKSLTQGASFADLLHAAKSGGLESKQALKLAEGVKASALTNEQLERLSAVTDQAEASGATRLLALVDGKAVTIDVTTRTALSVADAAGESGKGPVMTGIDSVVIVPASGGAEEAHAAPLVRGLPSNAALNRLLSGL